MRRFLRPCKSCYPRSIMRIAVAQIDSIVGDFSGNAEKIVAFAARAHEKDRADLVVFPELALCGYPPMDLLDQDSFAEGNVRALRSLQKKLISGITVGVGFVGRNTRASGKPLTNAYGFVANGQLVFVQEKTLLPTYDVFDEARYFEPSGKRALFPFMGERIGVAVCEDLWWETESTPGMRYGLDPVRELLDQGASMILAPSASPYFAGKFRIRKKLAQNLARRGGIPVVYINAVGANDSLVFDGRSFIVSPGDSPAIVAEAPGFEESLLLWDSEGNAPAIKVEPDQQNELDTIRSALVAGIRGYMSKCGFKRAHLGLSGGIDSALVAVLAAEAIGAENVTVFGLPSRYSSEGSKDDARELAENSGMRFVLLPIEGPFNAYLETLEDVFEGKPFDLAEENLQARIRGTLLMAYSNKFDSMLLTTGNKSELAVGYCTLYGDMCGALAPIGDLFKTEVFALCRRINETARAATGLPLIPEATLTKPPSAELRPNQTDQDSLPPYEDLDAVLSLHLLDNLSRAEITERGWDDALVSRVIRMVARAEYKRRQAPPVVKVSPKAFGMGRRFPIARAIHEL